MVSRKKRKKSERVNDQADGKEKDENKKEDEKKAVRTSACR